MRQQLLSRFMGLVAKFADRGGARFVFGNRWQWRRSTAAMDGRRDVHPRLEELESREVPSVSFAAQTTFALGNQPQGTTTADLNGDGRPDLITVNAVSNAVSVQLNTTTIGGTTPSFAAQQTFAVGAGPLAVAAGDINGDGNPDLAVVNQGANTVSLLLNTTPAGASAASFAAAQTIAVGANPQSVAFADINGDGRPDLIVLNQTAGTVSVFLNATAAGATTAAFAAQRTFAVGTTPLGNIGVGDVNSDGIPDVVVANFGDGTVSVLVNTTVNGATAASFAAQQTFAAGSAPGSVALADVNGDGRPDLAVSNINGVSGSTVAVLLNGTMARSPMVSFGAPQTFAVGAAPTYTQPVIMAPVTTVASIGPNAFNSPSLTAYFNGALFSLSGGAIGTAPATSGPAAYGAIGPNFGANQIVTTTIPSWMGVANPGGAFAGEHGNQIYFGVAITGGTASGNPLVTPTSGTAFQLSDVSISITSASDPTLDSTGPLPTAFSATLVGQKIDGTYTTAADPNTVYLKALYYVGISDGYGSNATTQSQLNADIASLTTRNHGPINLTGAYTVTMTTYPGGGTTKDTDSTTTNGNVTVPAVVVGDFNGDGRPDLAVGGQNGGVVAVLENSTTLGSSLVFFVAQQTFTGGAGPLNLIAADFNYDGRPDLAVSNSGSNSISLLFNNLAPSTFTVTGPVEVGDFTGYGVQQFNRTFGSWVQLTPVDANVLVANANGMVVGNFPGYGVQLYRPGLGWVQLTPSAASSLDIDGLGDIVGNFPGYGVNLYRSTTNWVKITPFQANQVAFDAYGNVYGSFPSYGLQKYSLVSNSWSVITPFTPTTFAVNAYDQIVGNFTGYGVQKFMPYVGSWVQLTPFAASSMAINSFGTVIANFPSYGVNQIAPTATVWTSIAPPEGQALSLDRYGRGFGSFPGYGTFNFLPLIGSWQQDATTAAVLLSAADFLFGLSSPFAS